VGVNSFPSSSTNYVVYTRDTVHL